MVVFGGFADVGKIALVLCRIAGVGLYIYIFTTEMFWTIG